MTEILKFLQVVVFLALIEKSTISQPIDLSTFSKFDIGPKVIGGIEANVHEFPFLANIQFYTRHGYVLTCGAVLISPEFVLTAAHCFPCGTSLTNYRVVAGDHFLKQHVTEKQERKIEYVSFHPHFGGMFYDLAVVRVKESFHIDRPHVDTIDLPKDNDVLEGNGVVVGWGHTSANAESIPNERIVPHKATVPFISASDCKNAYGDEFDTTTMICAGYPEGGIDTCSGDSGGPIIAQKNERQYVAGIVSWGYGCAQAGYPGIYTNLMNLAPWIRTVINSNGTKESTKIKQYFHTCTYDESRRQYKSREQQATAGKSAFLVILAIVAISVLAIVLLIFSYRYFGRF